MTSLTDSLGVIVAITVAGFVLTLLRSLLNGLFGALDRVAPSMAAARAPSVEPGARASAAAPLGPGPTTRGSADAAREQAPPLRSYADVQWEHREHGDEDPPGSTPSVLANLRAPAFGSKPSGRREARRDHARPGGFRGRTPKRTR